MAATGNPKQALLELVDNLARAVEAQQPDKSTGPITPEDTKACLQTLWANSSRQLQDAWNSLYPQQPQGQEMQHTACRPVLEQQMQHAAAVSSCLQLQQARWQQDVQEVASWADAPVSAPAAVKGDKWQQADVWDVGRQQQHGDVWRLEDSSTSTGPHDPMHNHDVQVLQLQDSFSCDDNQPVAGHDFQRVISSAGSDTEDNLMLSIGDSIGMQLAGQCNNGLDLEGYNSEGGAPEPGWRVMGGGGGGEGGHGGRHSKIHAAVRQLQHQLQQADAGEVIHSHELYSALQVLIRQSPDDVLAADCWQGLCTAVSNLLSLAAAGHLHASITGAMGLSNSPTSPPRQVAPWMSTDEGQSSNSHHNEIIKNSNSQQHLQCDPQPLQQTTLSQDSGTPQQPLQPLAPEDHTKPTVVLVLMQLLEQLAAECCATSPSHAAQLLQAMLPAVGQPWRASVSELAKEHDDKHKGLMCLAACAVQLLCSVAQDWHFIPGPQQGSLAAELCGTLSAAITQQALNHSEPTQQIEGEYRPWAVPLYLMLHVDSTCSWLQRLCCCSSTAHQMAIAALQANGCSNSSSTAAPEVSSGHVRGQEHAPMLHAVQQLLVDEQQVPAVQLHLLMCVVVGLIHIPTSGWQTASGPAPPLQTPQAGHTRGQSGHTSAQPGHTSAQPGHTSDHTSGSYAPMSLMSTKQSMLGCLVQLLQSHWAGSMQQRRPGDYETHGDEACLLWTAQQLLPQLAATQPQAWSSYHSMQQLACWAVPEQQVQSPQQQAVAGLAVAICRCLAGTSTGADVLMTPPPQPAGITSIQSSSTLQRVQVAQVAVPADTSAAFSRQQQQLPLLLTRLCKRLPTAAAAMRTGSSMSVEGVHIGCWQLLQVLAEGVMRSGHALQTQQACSELVAAQLLPLLQQQYTQHGDTHPSKVGYSSHGDQQGCALDALISWVCVSPTLLVRLYEHPYVATAMVQRLLRHLQSAAAIHNGTTQQHAGSRQLQNSSTAQQHAGTGQLLNRAVGVAGMLAIDVHLMQTQLLAAGWLQHLLFNTLPEVLDTQQLQDSAHHPKTATAASSGYNVQQAVTAVQATLSWTGVHLQLTHSAAAGQQQRLQHSEAAVQHSMTTLQRLVASLNQWPKQAPTEHIQEVEGTGTTSHPADTQPPDPLLPPSLALDLLSVWAHWLDALRSLDAVTNLGPHLTCLLHYARSTARSDSTGGKGGAHCDSTVEEGAGAVEEGAGAVEEGAGAVEEGAGAVEEGAGAVDEGAGAVDAVRQHDQPTKAAQPVLQVDEYTQQVLSLLHGLEQATATVVMSHAAVTEDSSATAVITPLHPAAADNSEAIQRFHVERGTGRALGNGRGMGSSTSMRQGAVWEVVSSGAGMPDPEAWLQEAAAAVQADLQHAAKLDWRAMLLLLQRCVLVAWPGVCSRAPGSEAASWAGLSSTATDSSRVACLPWQHLALHHTATRTAGGAPSAIALNTAGLTLGSLAQDQLVRDTDPPRTHDTAVAAAQGGAEAAGALASPPSAADALAKSIQAVCLHDSTRGKLTQDHGLILGQEGCETRQLAAWLDSLCITTKQQSMRLSPTRQRSLAKQQSMARQQSLNHSPTRQQSLNLTPSCQQPSLCQPPTRQQSVNRQQAGYLLTTTPCTANHVLPQAGYLLPSTRLVCPQADRFVAAVGVLCGVASSPGGTPSWNAAVEMLQGLLKAPTAMYIWPGLAASCGPAGLTQPAAALCTAIGFVLQSSAPRIWAAAGGHAGVGTSTLLHHCIRWLGLSPSAVTTSMVNASDTGSVAVPPTITTTYPGIVAAQASIGTNTSISTPSQAEISHAGNACGVRGPAVTTRIEPQSDTAAGQASTGISASTSTIPNTGTTTHINGGTGAGTITPTASIAWWDTLPAEQAMEALAMTIICGPDYLVYCCVAALASVEEALLAAVHAPGGLIGWLSDRPLQHITTWGPLIPHISELCQQHRHTVLPFLMSQAGQPLQ